MLGKKRSQQLNDGNQPFRRNVGGESKARLKQARGRPKGDLQEAA